MKKLLIISYLLMWILFYNTSNSSYNFTISEKEKKMQKIKYENKMKEFDKYIKK